MLMLDKTGFFTELADPAKGALLEDVNHRIQCFNKIVHFSFCIVDVRRGSGGRADAQSMMQRLRAVVPRSHSNACTFHNILAHCPIPCIFQDLSRHMRQRSGTLL